jgi:oligogalacturonide lyase
MSIASTESEIRNFGLLSLYVATIIVLLLVHTSVSVGQAASGVPSTETKIIPYSWIDADNGYHVIRLTNEPGSRALGSNRNAFTPDGKDMIYLSDIGLHVINLATRRSKIIVPGHIQSLAAGTKTRRVFFNRGTDIYLYAVDIDTGVITKLGDLPLFGEIMSVNSDETLIAGKNVERGGTIYAEFLLKATRELIEERKVDPSVKVTDDNIQERAMKLRAAAKIPEDMFTVNVQTGQVNTILKTTDWLGYAQFSPTDPTLILYTHEGMYYETDRIRTIRSDGSQDQLIHQRTEKEESATREFWSQDGKTIWYEWQKPRGKNYALVGYDVATGKRRLFKMEKGQASISYNAAGGDAFFCGSGHRAVSATAGNNRGGKQSIELLYPVVITKKIQDDPEFTSLYNFDDEMAHTYPDTKYVGWFRRVTIANMFKNDYTKIEPNIRVSPDNKLVIFTSNMLGSTYIFAVELNPN